MAFPYLWAWWKPNAARPGMKLVSRGEWCIACRAVDIAVLVVVFVIFVPIMRTGAETANKGLLSKRPRSEYLRLVRKFLFRNAAETE